MDEETLNPGDVVETRELWLVQFQQVTSVWQDISTHRADPRETLRIYDFWVENHPDASLRVTKTHVETRVADVQELREAAEKKAAEDIESPLPPK